MFFPARKTTGACIGQGHLTTVDRKLAGGGGYRLDIGPWVYMSLSGTREALNEPFGADCSVVQFASQKYTDQNVQNYNFASFFFCMGVRLCLSQ